MKLKNEETLYCDVLVVGGGGAGLRSAIAARLRGADVLLISKSRVGYSTNTFISKAAIAATGWGTSEDRDVVHLADTIKGGRFLNDQAMAVKVTEKAHSEIAFLMECGVCFGMEKGRPDVVHTPGHRYPRHVYGENWIGSDLVFPIKRRAKKEGVRFIEQAFVTRLLATEDRITGATAVTKDGMFLTIQAKAVILATGGYAQIFLNTNNVPGITGDGQALCYDLGVPLKDMEFIQFYPTATGKRGNRILLYERFLVLPKVVLRNRDGEDILGRHGFSDPMRLTRDQLAQLIMKEMTDGGTLNNGVIMDLEALSDDKARQMTQLLPSRWWKGQKTYEVAPTAHFCMGGIVTDQSGETSVRGLFAVGEATAGVHGANRLGGNALTEIFVMGSLVGKNAGECVMDMEPAFSPEEVIEAEKSRLEGSFSVEGLNPKQMIQELKKLMWHKAGVIRKKNELEEALVRIQDSWPRAFIVNPADLINQLEFENMRMVAEMVCTAALKRTETRGSHFRVDYPEEDNEWLKNIVLRKGDSGMEFEMRPVRLDLVKPELD